MKTIIAGSRSITDRHLVSRAVINSGFTITEVVCGCARGVDALGAEWATENKVHVKLFPAEWNKYGKSAGLIRNIEMALYAEALIAVWDCKSRGTKHMIDFAKNKGLSVFVYTSAGVYR